MRTFSLYPFWNSIKKSMLYKILISLLKSSVGERTADFLSSILRIVFHPAVPFIDKKKQQHKRGNKNTINVHLDYKSFISKRMSKLLWNNYYGRRKNLEFLLHISGEKVKVFLLPNYFNMTGSPFIVHTYVYTYIFIIGRIWMFRRE